MCSGATNAGRLLGKPGFVVVFALDFLKGAVVVGAAAALGLGPYALALVALAVTAGHIWPIQLRFRGGKGIATSLGTLLVYDVRTILLLVGVFLLCFAVCRRLTPSGLLAFALCPVVLLALRAPASTVIAMGALASVIWVAHRGNLAREFRRLRTKDAPPVPPGKSTP